MDEYFVNITPTSLSFKNVDLSDLSYKNARLELTLICPTFKSELKISFDWIHSFRVADAGDLLGMSGKHGIHQTGNYRVVNSACLAWFTMQRCENHKNKMIEHYVIATSNDVINVLSTILRK
ncbi:hypothetical protein ABJ851_003925 [Shigella flexneri]|nr:hypothetical protein [Escherichia coli]